MNKGIIHFHGVITISVTFYWCTYIVIDSDIRDKEELLYNSDGTSDSGT